MLGDDIVENKISYINKISNLTRKYNKKYNEYLRKINELIDFSFVYDELLDKYCINNGRNAIDLIRMFKYLLLKSIFDLSDLDIVERSKYDMSFKYFL